MNFMIHQGDALTVLRTMPEASVHCCITSPPYWGLRDYGTARWEGGAPDCDHVYNHGTQGATGQRATRTFTAQAVYRDECRKCGAVRLDQQIGLERTPTEYVERMVEVFGEVRRVLRDDGTLWMNLGDSYARDEGKGQHKPGDAGKQNYIIERGNGRAASAGAHGLKPKDLGGIPWRVALALQADGWWLRSDIIWAKPAPMPESVTDRPTRSHEYIFLLAKSEKYYCDMESVKEPAVCGHPSGNGYKRDARLSYDGRGSDEPWKPREVYANQSSKHLAADPQSGQRRLAESVTAARKATGDHDNPFGDTRNLRDVWIVNTQPFPEAHFATFPPRLIEPCVIAGCPAGGTILDPFAGAGTTGLVAKKHGRNFTGIELNPDYVAMAEKRLAQEVMQFSGVSLENGTAPEAQSDAGKRNSEGDRLLGGDAK